jgi:kumamolisin
MEFKLKQHGALATAVASLFLGCTAVAGAAALDTASDHVLRNAADDEQVHFALSLPYPDQAALAAFNEDLYNPASPNFHKFLSSQEFDARFAPTQAQYDSLKSLAKQYGFTITGERASHTLLDVSASAATVRSVFGTQMQHHVNEDGKDYLIGAAEAVEPFPMSAVGIHAVGLNSAPPRPRFQNAHKVAEPQTDAQGYPRAGSQASGYYAPADLKNAYNLNGIQNGGLPVAVIEFSGATYTDAATYASKFGLNNPTIVQKDVGSHSTSLNGATEVMLDIEMVEAIESPKTIYVYTGAWGSSATPALYQQIADDNLVVAMSSSWGSCEKDVSLTQAQAEDTAFQKMVSEGMAAFAAAGDTGAHGCLRQGQPKVIDAGDPASGNITVVGGTSLNTTSSQDWVSETVWNDGKKSSGGGGISTFWAIPSYQKNVVFNGPSGQYSTTMRNVPDVALDADPNTGVYMYCSFGGGGWEGMGGTSDAAPQYAGFWGLVSKGVGKAAGFANPTLYALAGNSSKYASDFHDITQGNNNYYNAYVGFDDASGWGSYNGGNLYKDVLTYVTGASSPAVKGGSAETP